MLIRLLVLSLPLCTGLDAFTRVQGLCFGGTDPFNITDTDLCLRLGNQLFIKFLEEYMITTEEVYESEGRTVEEFCALKQDYGESLRALHCFQCRMVSPDGSPKKIYYDLGGNENFVLGDLGFGEQYVDCYPRCDSLANPRDALKLYAPSDFAKYPHTGLASEDGSSGKIQYVNHPYLWPFGPDCETFPVSLKELGGCAILEGRQCPVPPSPPPPEDDFGGNIIIGNFNSMVFHVRRMLGLANY